MTNLAQTATLYPERESLSAWLRLYMEIEGAAGAANTTEAKARDLEAFVRFWKGQGFNDQPDLWTLALTRAFLTSLEGQGKSAATINRMLATLRRAATWIGEQRPFLAGHPCERLRDLEADEPAWKGLTEEEWLRLCDTASERAERGGGLAMRNAALLFVLLHTGLRISELLALNLAQWDGRYLCNVRRKGRVVTRRVFVASEASAMLEKYLDQVRVQEPGALFQSRTGRRLLRQNANGVLKGLAAEASIGIDREIKLSAHVLRHTMLRRTAEMHGVAYAKEVSGHVSDRYIWRYVKPSQEEQEQALEGLFKA